MILMIMICQFFRFLEIVFHVKLLVLPLRRGLQRTRRVRVPVEVHRNVGDNFIAFVLIEPCHALCVFRLLVCNAAEQTD